MPAPTRDARALAVILGGSGVLHLVRPQTFEPMVPAFVPAHREVVLGSGVAELVCAAGLLHPRTRRLAGWASAALLVGVYPANLKMAGDAVKGDDRRLQAATLGRLPLQVPLVRRALRVARSA